MRIVSSCSFPSLSSKDSCDANGLGHLGKLGFDLGLVLGDLGLLRLHFFDERQKFLVVLGRRSLRNHWRRGNYSDESKGKKRFHRKKWLTTELASHVPQHVVDLA